MRKVRKQTLKWKKEQAAAEKIIRAEVRGGTAFVCQQDGEMIDASICSARQIRYSSDGCIGCKNYGG